MKTALRISAASLSAFNTGLALATQRMEEAANTGLHNAAKSTFDLAQRTVPRVTNALADSGKLTERSSGQLLRQIISYGDSTRNPNTGLATAAYAVQVHELFDPAHPDSYKWLEKAVRTYGQETFLDTLAMTIRKAL